MEGGSTDPFPEINASKQLNLGVPEHFPVDPISSKLDLDKFYKEEAAEAWARANARESEKRKLEGSSLKSTLIISGVVAVAIAAAFIVSKRLKNTS